MGKRLLNLYVEDGDVELAKSKGIILSQFFRECLKIENASKKDKLTEKEKIRKLSNKVALLSAELIEKNKIIERLKKEEDKNKMEPFDFRRYY